MTRNIELMYCCARRRGNCVISVYFQCLCGDVGKALLLSQITYLFEAIIAEVTYKAIINEVSKVILHCDITLYDEMCLGSVLEEICGSNSICCI